MLTFFQKFWSSRKRVMVDATAWPENVRSAVIDNPMFVLLDDDQTAKGIADSLDAIKVSREHLLVYADYLARRIKRDEDLLAMVRNNLIEVSRYVPDDLQPEVSVNDKKPTLVLPAKPAAPTATKTTKADSMKEWGAIAQAVSRGSL